MSGLADTGLALFFSRGMALTGWAASGLLGRELALYRALAPHLASVALVTYGGPADRALAPGLDGVGVVAAPVPRLPQRLWVPWLVHGARLPRPGIYKSNQVSGAEVALAAARRRKQPFLCRLGYPYWLNQAAAHGPESPEAHAAHALEARVFAGADLIQVTSAYVARRYADAHGIDPARFRVVPNYVDAELFRPPDTPPANPRPVVGFVGRLSPEKNLENLFRACAGLDLELRLAGDGPARCFLAALAADLDLAVRFLGPLPHAALPGFLAGCDLYAQPSLYEGHPKSLCEAMAMGLCCLATDVRGIRDTIAHGQSGWLTGTDTEAIRAGLEALLADAALRAELGRGARRSVEADLAFPVVLARELAVLAELVP